MMNIRQRSVNVNRLELLAKLRANLETHKAEYAEALAEYQQRLLDDLKLAAKKVAKVTDPNELKNFRFSVPFPQNHEADYAEVIEMLEMSVDETINLDSESFKAYIKNEWHWQTQFTAAKMAYVTAGSSLTL
jgi:beta-xylosidase